MKWNRVIPTLALLLIAGLASAQVFTLPPPAGVVMNGGVFNTTPPTLTNGQTGFAQLDSQGRYLVVTGAVTGVQNGGFPAGSTPITAVFSGADTSSATATLAASAGKFTYICGFNLTGQGATAATTVTPTVGALIGGNTFTYTGAYTFVAGATLFNAPVSFSFNQCIPANVVNTAIVVTLPGAAGNTATTINAWGFQL